MYSPHHGRYDREDPLDLIELEEMAREEDGHVRMRRVDSLGSMGNLRKVESIGEGLFNSDLEWTSKKLDSRIVWFVEMIKSIDPDIPESSIRDLRVCFQDHAEKIKHHLYYSIQGITSPSDVHIRMKNAIGHFIEVCYQETLDRLRDHHHLVKTVNLMRKINIQEDHDVVKEVKEGKKKPLQRERFFKRAFFTVRDHLKPTPFYEMLKHKVPIIKWLPSYSLGGQLRGDLMSGITVGMMMIPQGMAYAAIAGLPPIYGLYAGFIPALIYTFFGTSSDVSVGPATMLSLMVPSILAEYYEVGTPEYIAHALYLTFAAGLALLLLGLFRFGDLLENVLSYPNMVGFVQGGAVLTAASQMKGYLRISVSTSAVTLPQYIIAFIQNFKNIHGWTVLMATCGVLLVVGIKKLKRDLPAPLILLIVGILVTWAFRLDQYGLDIVGVIPSGLPTPTVPGLDLNIVQETLSDIFILALLGFLETISVAKKFAWKKKYHVDTNQELIALGMCNFVGSWFGSFPISGSFSRGAILYASGSKTPLQSFIVGAMMGGVLLFFTSWFYYTPKALLAALVIAASWSLMDFGEMVFLYKMDEIIDLSQLLLTFLGTIVLGPTTGLALALGLSLIQLIADSANPTAVQLGRLPGTVVYKNFERYPQSITKPGVVVFRFDSDLLFYTCQAFQHSLEDIEHTYNGTVRNPASFPGSKSVKTEAGPNRLRAVVIDCSRINTMDSSAMHLLTNIMGTFRGKGVLLVWCCVKEKVRDSMVRSGLTLAHKFSTTHEAVDFVVELLQQRGDNQLEPPQPDPKDPLDYVIDYFCLKIRKQTEAHLEHSLVHSSDTASLIKSHDHENGHVTPSAPLLQTNSTGYGTYNAAPVRPVPQRINTVQQPHLMGSLSSPNLGSTQRGVPPLATGHLQPPTHNRNFPTSPLAAGATGDDHASLPLHQLSPRHPGPHGPHGAVTSVHIPPTNPYNGPGQQAPAIAPKMHSLRGHLQKFHMSGSYRDMK